MEEWKAQFIHNGGVRDPDDFPFIILANKCDKEDKREVSEEQIDKWCKKMGDLRYFNTSAKHDFGVDQAFKCMVELAAKKAEEEPE